jgi:hypothetical protein
MALHVGSSKGAEGAPIQGFLATNTTSRSGNNEVWDRPRDQNHIVGTGSNSYRNPPLLSQARGQQDVRLGVS